MAVLDAIMGQSILPVCNDPDAEVCKRFTGCHRSRQERLACRRPSRELEAAMAGEGSRVIR
jgi:hypothetical protein